MVYLDVCPPSGFLLNGLLNGGGAKSSLSSSSYICYSLSSLKSRVGIFIKGLDLGYMVYLSFLDFLLFFFSDFRFCFFSYSISSSISFTYCISGIVIALLRFYFNLFNYCFCAYSLCSCMSGIVIALLRFCFTAFSFCLRASSSSYSCSSSYFWRRLPSSSFTYY